MIISMSSPRFQPGDIATVVLHEIGLVDNPNDASKKRLEIKFKEDGGDRMITLSLRTNTWVDPTKLYADGNLTPQKAAEARFKAYANALTKYKDARAAAEATGVSVREVNKAVKAELKALQTAYKELGVAFLGREDFDKFMSYWFGAVGKDPMCADMVTDAFTGVTIKEDPAKTYTTANYGEKKYVMDPNVTGKPSLSFSFDENAYLKSLSTCIRKTLLGTKAQVMICGEAVDGNVYAKLLVPAKTVTVLPVNAAEGDVKLHFNFDPKVHIVQGYSKNAPVPSKPAQGADQAESSDDTLPF